MDADHVLCTTRAVRRRLDLERPVPEELVRQCLEIALQAPSGSNAQGWHFVVVTDAERRAALADCYRRAFAIYRELPIAAANLPVSDERRAAQQQRVMTSAEFLTEHLHEVPVHVIPCIEGRVDGQPSVMQAAVWGSILPAVWSFMLAARARGLGTSWTTLHLMFEEEAAGILGIPFAEVTQAALIPLAYTIGAELRPATREPLDRVVHWNSW
ncbi:MAG: nitroreductase family protein [Actinobacteria bacterium]|nr:nitroreductase family protein [Actinomycetota bacterium]